MPGEIESFRFEENGKYFVSRRLNVTGVPQLYFAEFIVNGKMNLYCVVYDSDEYFFFEREDGEMAELVNRAFNSKTSREIVDEKRVQYAEVKSLLKDSNKAMFAVDGVDMSREKLVGIVRDYHNDVCTDGSTCMVYEYKPESDEYKFHVKVGGGYSYYSQEMTDQQHFAKENYPGSVGEFGIGVEIELERILKGLSIEGDFGFSTKLKSEHDIEEKNLPTPTHSTYEKSIATISFGGVERFGKGKIQPLVRAGAFGVFHINPKEHRYTPYNKRDVELKWNSSMHFGVYVGAGAQLNLGKHFIRLHGDLYKSLESYSRMTKWGVTAEFGI